MSRTDSPNAVSKPKRRWHQYSLRTLFCLPVVLAIVLSAIYSWPQVQRRYIVWRLRDYVDKDLQRLPMEERVRVDGWLRFLVGEEPERSGKGMIQNGDRLFLAVDATGACPRMFVIQTDITSSPLSLGNLGVLHTLDSSGRLLCSRLFRDSNKIESATLNESQRGFKCLTIETRRTDTEVRQIYRVTEDNVEWLRSEERNGKFAMGRLELGHTSPDSSDWPRLLDLPDQLQQLRGLAAFFSVRDKTKRVDDKVRLCLAELAKSPDPWITEEAKLALAEAEKK